MRELRCTRLGACRTPPFTIQSRTSIANQTVNTAATQATSGITSTAHSVYNDLQSLLNPTTNVVNKVLDFITAGKNLMQNVQQMDDLLVYYNEIEEIQRTLKTDYFNSY